MRIVFSQTCTGYKHTEARCVCEDFSASYCDKNRAIITCADGHGGDIYVRSHIGSQLASDAVINVFRPLTSRYFTTLAPEEVEYQLKMAILCEWNKLVERNISQKRISKAELSGLCEDKMFDVMLNPTIAFGTTLTGAMALGDKLVVVGIGDSETLLLQKGKVVRVFNNDDDPAGNITYSMCQEDAFNYLKVRVLDMKEYDGILLCSDGLVGPYQTYQNFEDNFVKPIFEQVITSKSTCKVAEAVSLIASKAGNGDDVSLSFIFNLNSKVKDYQQE